MSLATRCTSCATVFRVVQDQLKVSEGWVRCGRCDTVFNALEHLFDLERDGLPADPATGERTPHESLPDLPSETVDKPPLADAFDALLRERSLHRDENRGAAVEAEPEAAPVHRDLLLEVPGADLPPAAATPAEIDDGSPPPSFVRAAERDARWQQPRVRWALRGAAALLLGGLALQAAHHFRDSFAARWPQTLPALKAWCGVIGCRIEPLRRIGDVTVENTALVPGAAGSVALSVTLRNRGKLPLALPSVDLSLTDSNGQLVSRRALAPAEFTVGGSAAPGAPLLRPDTDTRLQTTLATTQRVVGYTVEVFYP